MANRIACCPRAKQIVGVKSWLGYAGSFNFPGFKGNWQYPNYTGYGAYIPPGQWIYTAAGGALNPNMSGGVPVANFNVGDLVLREFPDTDSYLQGGGFTLGAGITDYLTGLTWHYPKYYHVYICTTAITGSTADPALDTSHFKDWDFHTFDVIGGVLYSDRGAPQGGPTSWPMDMAARALFAVATDTAKIELTVTTELDNFPLFPATISVLTAKIGYSNDTAPAFADMTVPEESAAGTFAYNWTFPNNYDGATATYTPPGTAPSTNQSPLLFPSVPWRRIVDYNPTAHWDGGNAVCDSVYAIDSSFDLPSLVSWSFSATSLSFGFAAWSWQPWLLYSYPLNHYGSLATAPGTITQTITLGGDAYTLSDVAAQAEALMNATAFDSIAWGTSWTNTYDAGGNIVSTQNTGNTVATAITAGCAVGTPVKWGVAVNGCPWASGETAYFLTKALVDVCGNYCQRTYNCPTVTCASGNVDGYAPVSLDPATIAPGESMAIYAGCQCT